MAHPQDSHGDGITPIRDAACVVLVDRSDAEPRLLLGRRPATQVFLPNKWVFPGGRVDDGDHAITAAATDPADHPDGAQYHYPFACAAVRELFEETGILIGNDLASPAWQLLLPPGPLPGTGGLQPLARAITPPGFPRRFDTWFYLANWERTRARAGTPDGELLDLSWFTISEVRALDLAIITRLIVDDVATALNPPSPSAATLIPFYYQDVDGYRRTLIPALELVASP